MNYWRPPKEYRILLWLLGTLLPQAIISLPALSGERLALPMDHVYRYRPYHPLGKTPSSSPVFSDQCLVGEPWRAFATKSIRAGEIPYWNPHSYCGTPFAVFSVYSPYMIPRYLFPAPETQAWIVLLKALVISGGVYLLARRTFRLGVPPSLLAAWCSPMLGYFVVWQGDTVSDAASWFPLMLFTVDRVCRRPSGRSAALLALITAASILSGHPDISAQAMLGSGAFSLFLLVTRFRSSRRVARTVLFLSLGWFLGVLISLPYLVPYLDYIKTGIRIADRSTGIEERPPGRLIAGLDALFAERSGSSKVGAIFISDSPNMLESAASGYAGLITVLGAAPFAFASRRRRALVIFFAVFALFGLSWVMGLPGFVDFLRLPGLQLFSHNRMTFFTAVAFLMVGATGFHELCIHPSRKYWYPFLTVMALLALAISSSLRAGQFQEIANSFANRDAVKQIGASLMVDYQIRCGAIAIIGAVLTGAAARGLGRWHLAPAMSVCMFVELFLFTYDFQPLCMPEDYFPKVEALEWIAKAPPGRILVAGDFPPDLALAYGLRDIRGYDGVDPQPIVELLRAVPREKTPEFPYSVLQFYYPKFAMSAEGTPRNRVLDLLDVRHLILFSLKNPFNVSYVSGALQVYENSHAVGRVFVPKSVLAVPNKEDRLARLVDPAFEPEQNAFLEVDHPPLNNCVGTASVLQESTNELTIEAKLETPGLMVFTDCWSHGWQAEVEGRSVPIHKVNHALQGILLEPGTHIVQMRYRPPGFLATRYAALAACALMLVLAWKFPK